MRFSRTVCLHMAFVKLSNCCVERSQTLFRGNFDLQAAHTSLYPVRWTRSHFKNTTRAILHPLAWVFPSGGCSGMTSCYLLSSWNCYTDTASRRHLRSASRHHLSVPRYRLSTFGRRAFSVPGPTVWNSLPDSLGDPALSSSTYSPLSPSITHSLHSIPGSKLTFSTNLFHHSLLAPTWTAFSDYTGPDLLCSTVFHF